MKANELTKTASSLAELPFGITRQNRTKNNILQRLCDKLLKKQISNRFTLKTAKVSFEYFEADYLEQYLLEFNTIYDDHDIQRVIDKLNQKLA